ncbi:MAG TPA: hypothetical protein VIX42_12725 [Edaphobacter sp.]
MTALLNSDSTQLQILRTYTILNQLRPDWGGGLILSLGLDSQGAALSIAANIVGAVSLAIDNNPIHIREIFRTGACDFVVNTLDEAIRAMKNEARKHAPLSVALNADPFLALAEIIKRGLGPQLFSTFLHTLTSEQTHILSQTVNQFQSQGASLIDFTDQPDPDPFTSSNTLLAALITERHWTLQTHSFETTAALRVFDTQALSLLSPEDTLRRRWLEAAPRILQRERPPRRALWLTDQESAILL